MQENEQKDKSVLLFFLFAQNTKSWESFLSKHRVIRNKLYCYFSDVRQYAELTCWDTWCCGGVGGFNHKC